MNATFKTDPIDRSEEGAKQGYPRRRDWEAVAGRLNNAWYKLRTLTPVDRANIPNVMQTRRLIEAVNSISEKLNTVEQKLEWLDARISSLESKFISNKH